MNIKKADSFYNHCHASFIAKKLVFQNSAKPSLEFIVRLSIGYTNMDQKKIDFSLYVLKCLIGAIIGFFIYRSFPESGAWSLVSILLVLSPEGKDAINLAEVRIKANLVGAGTGLVLFFLHPPAFFMVCLGVVIVLVICELLKLQAASRSALASVVIICIHESGKYFYQVALQRAAGVIGGCLIALLITYLVHYKTLISNVRERKARISWRRNQFKKQIEVVDDEVEK